MDAASLQKVFAVNAFGPILVSKVTMQHATACADWGNNACNYVAMSTTAARWPHLRQAGIWLQAFAPLLINAVKANGASE